MRMLLVLLGLLAVPGTGFAQDKVLKSGVADCVAANVASRAPIAACLQDAQAACGQYPGNNAQTLDCYVAAKAEWAGLIKDLLASFADRPESFREIARIEAKYSVSRNLMACARQMELLLIGREFEIADGIAKAQCEAQATGVSYVELLMSSGEVPQPQ